jgi:hypothetical protein
VHHNRLEPDLWLTQEELLQPQIVPHIIPDNIHRFPPRTWCLLLGLPARDLAPAWSACLLVIIGSP